MAMTLGIDVGSSSVKVSLLDLGTGLCAASVTVPGSEMPILSLKKGWAEQEPALWWDYVCEAIGKLAAAGHSMSAVEAVGITYQMHGLVCLDKDRRPLRPSIIWCDSRAVEIGGKAFEELGPERCLAHLLNSPGNFTASKMAWVRENEPEVFAATDKFCLPGDWIAYMLTGEVTTTRSGLSEQILWDFAEDKMAGFVADYYGLPASVIPEVAPSIGIQGRTSAATQALLGIPEGTPIAYRAGDQPNNAFSLGVLRPGEIAATGGTSGVVYGVTDQPKADPLSRVNTFLHVNHSPGTPRYGVLLCINGTGILNAWVRRNMAPELDYAQVNELCATIGAGSDGVVILPFGNGAERMLGNRYTGACIAGLDLNRHTRAHVLRAAQEGIACAFRYGVDIMKGTGLVPKVIRAGNANLFLSPVFRQTLSTLCGARIELYDTDGALGAARGAALGAGLYSSPEEAFSSLALLGSIEPDPGMAPALEECYGSWKKELTSKLNR